MMEDIMSAPKTINFSPVNSISLKKHPEINESWVQQVLYENPNLLGLSPTITARDKERIQPSGGRLDLLLQDEETNVRYEVEVQLGATDETHIIRTIEYWDVERKRYPQYDHVAVIVAEDITARFFNVISLFNSAIPLIALKMTAVQNSDGSIGLLFTKVLDLATPESDEDDQTVEQTDRTYWEKRSSKDILRCADRVFETIKEFEPRAELSFNKFYLGIWIEGRANNFVVIRPRRNYFYVDIKLERTASINELIENSEFDESIYTKEGRYRIRMDSKTSENGRQLVKKLMQMAYEE